MTGTRLLAPTSPILAVPRNTFTWGCEGHLRAMSRKGRNSAALIDRSYPDSPGETRWIARKVIGLSIVSDSGKYQCIAFVNLIQTILELLFVAFIQGTKDGLRKIYYAGPAL